MSRPLSVIVSSQTWGKQAWSASWISVSRRARPVSRVSMRILGRLLGFLASGQNVHPAAMPRRREYRQSQTRPAMVKWWSAPIGNSLHK